ASMPSDATARAAALQTVDAGGVLETANLTSITPGQLLYIKAFAYEKVDGSGLESPAVTTIIKHGTRPRGFVFDDGLWPMRAQTDDGTLADPTVRLDPANGVYEGSAVYKIYRHREEITVNGADADGDFPVTFAQIYQSVPMIVLKGGQY